MSGFELILEQVQPFDGVELVIDVRISGTYRDRDNYTIDYVEVPSRNDPSALHNPRDGWRMINVLHPLYRGSTVTDGIGWIVDSEATADRIDAVIKAEMEADYQPSPYALAAE